MEYDFRKEFEHFKQSLLGHTKSVEYGGAETNTDSNGVAHELSEGKFMNKWVT